MLNMIEVNTWHIDFSLITVILFFFLVFVCSTLRFCRRTKQLQQYTTRCEGMFYATNSARIVVFVGNRQANTNGNR